MAVAYLYCIVDVSLFELPHHEVQLVEEARHLKVPEYLEVVEAGAGFEGDETRQAGEDVEDKSGFDVSMGDLLEAVYGLAILVPRGDKFSGDVAQHDEVQE